MTSYETTILQTLRQEYLDKHDGGPPPTISGLCMCVEWWEQKAVALTLELHKLRRGYAESIESRVNRRYGQEL